MTAIPVAIALLALAGVVWLLWPRSPQKKERVPRIEPGIAAWERDCAERKASGRWNWGKR
jgi:hypothetical protein